jgi:hypothetical protein
MNEIEITLEEAPEELQEAVANIYKRNLTDYKILTVKKVTSNPFFNKSIEFTTYKAYLQYGNTMKLVNFNEHGLTENSMIVGDMVTFLDYWNKYLENL